jgi:hypothetical protein
VIEFNAIPLAGSLYTLLHRPYPGIGVNDRNSPIACDLLLRKGI